jgi:HD-GYP domain-containing protein (c-di-GMP phosphodiesterase class II)
MDFEELVGEQRQRKPQPMTDRERTVVGTLAFGLLLSSVALTFIVPDRVEFQPALAAMLVILFALSSGVVFEVGSVSCVANQLVLIPMLFLLPLPTVPPLVALACVLAGVPGQIRGVTHWDRWLYGVADAMFAIGPVLVIGLLAPGELSVDKIPVYALALAAQVLLIFAEVAILDWFVHGLSPRESLAIAAQVCRIEVALSPIAFLVAAVGAQEPVTVLGLAPLLWLLHTFSKERSERYAAALELHQAYRGTVMVLADVVEADDNYTADHCRSVVELAVATAEVLGLGHREIQELETAALMHDVGKIAIPKEILNKPAKLTDEEFELMKSHTIEGQALLDRVGGRLARVGEIVRSCHERWDGRGYPDGLRGEEIPLAARIVFCCDAYSAMTTDRPYRAATTPEAAIAELRANAGTQFEPRVVDAVCRVVATDIATEERQYADAVRAVLASNSSIGARVEAV